MYMTNKAKIGDICELIWVDATGKMKEHSEFIKNVEPKKLLVLTKTYGILQAQDDKGVIILQEESNDESDFTAVPLGCIIKINVLRKK